jgi:hypothetical protein
LENHWIPNLKVCWISNLKFTKFWIWNLKKSPKFEFDIWKNWRVFKFSNVKFKKSLNFKFEKLPNFKVSNFEFENHWILNLENCWNFKISKFKLNYGKIDNRIKLRNIIFSKRTWKKAWSFDLASGFFKIQKHFKSQTKHILISFTTFQSHESSKNTLKVKPNTFLLASPPSNLLKASPPSISWKVALDSLIHTPLRQDNLSLVRASIRGASGCRGRLWEAAAARSLADPLAWMIFGPGEASGRRPADSKSWICDSATFNEAWTGAEELGLPDRQILVQGEADGAASSESTALASHWWMQSVGTIVLFNGSPVEPLWATLTRAEGLKFDGCSTWMSWRGRQLLGKVGGHRGRSRGEGGATGRGSPWLEWTTAKARGDAI